MNFYNLKQFQKAYPDQYYVPTFNPQQFANLIASLNQESIDRLVNMARQRGISETDIKKGLETINSIR